MIQLPELQINKNIFFFLLIIIMVKKIMKAADGKYHHNGKKYEVLIGSRAEVWHGKAYKTMGNLTRNDLIMNNRGRIVSKKKHNTAKKEKRLEKAGYFTQKGKFGFVKKGVKTSKKSKGKKRTMKKRKTLGKRKNKSLVRSIAKRLNILRKR